MPRFDDGVVNSKLEKGDIILMGNPTQYGEILAENFLVEDITRANLQTLISASELVRGKCYRVTNAVGSTLSLIVQALTANTITDVAYNTINGDLYTYNITADTATQGIVSDVVDFDPQTAPAYLRGRVWYDSDTESLSYYDDISGTSNQIGKEEHVRVRNTTGVAITNGSVVYVSGATGQTPQITLAQANADGTSNVIGIATHEIANNAFGKVTTFGIVNDVNTLAFAEGSILYLSQSVAGGLTSTRPPAPNFAVIVGICLHSHATQGKILVNTNKQGLGFGTANQLLGINAGATGQEYKTLNGTTSQVVVTNASGSITLSLPQSIATNSSVQFGSLALTTALPATSGGTGLNTYAVGDLVIANTTTTLSRLADVATGNALISGGVGVAPSYGKIGLTTHVSGTLPVGNGGTGITTTPSNGFVPIGNGTNYVSASLTGTANQVVVTNGSGSITLSLPQSIATTSSVQFGRIGLGAVVNNQILRVSGNITGATVMSGVASTGTVQSDVTSQIRLFNSQLITQAASFTLSNAYHYSATQGTIGATSSVTTQVGFWAEGTLTGATNNYGFQGEIPSGANRWNLYMNGTAANHLQGDLLIGTTSNPSSRKLLVNGNAEVTDIISNKAAGNSRGLQIQTSGVDRWYLRGTTGAESGSNAGSDFAITRYNDAGVLIDSPFVINRATGETTLSTPLGRASGGTGLGNTPTNGQLLIGNGTGYTLAGITGTANQVTVTNGAGTITLSLPQAINTTATPRFSRLEFTTSGSSGLLGNRIIPIVTDISGGGATNAFVIDVTSQITSDVTSDTTVFRSNPRTQAATFALATLTNFDVSNQAFGAGSSVTTQNGFRVNSTMVNATTNYAFRSQLAVSGTNRWNFYADGTAPNAFVGQTIFGSTTLVTSALVALSSTTQGFRPPVMTTAQRDAIVSPTAGLMIYNTTTNKLNVYTTAWEQVTSA